MECERTGEKTEKIYENCAKTREAETYAHKP